MQVYILSCSTIAGNRRHTAIVQSVVTEQWKNGAFSVAIATKCIILYVKKTFGIENTG